MVLLTLDTDLVKNYVFATSKLREIRGASALLDEINEIRIREIIDPKPTDPKRPERVVYAGGGTALAELEDSDEADALIKEVERLYRRETISAEVTGAWIEVPDSRVLFGEAVNELNYKLRARKEAKLPRRSVVTSPVLKVCESCGLYPAARRSEAKDNLICDPCALKRQANRQVRKGKVRSRLAELLEYAGSQGKWPDISIEENAPQDFNDIGAVATPKGYIGFIYCDGNRMGDLLSKLGTRESFKEFSVGVRQILQEITFAALLKHFPDQRCLPDHKRKPVLPFEIIFIGGDDMVLVVAADKAIELAIYLCQEFELRTRPLLEQVGRPAQREHLSLSAAVVLAHASLPIYHLQSIADDLLKSAKREGQRRNEADNVEVGHIDFHVVTASASEAPLLMRKTDWTREEGAIRLTERPYTAEDLQRLLGRIRALKQTGFPSSKLQMLYESILGGSKVQAMFRWAFVAGRAKRNKEPERDQMRKLFEFFLDGTGPVIWPWRECKPGRLSTPMLDVAELYDFTKTEAAK
jgi:hypothetical protein